MPGNFWGTLSKPILALAPMEGVTDEAFRVVCKRGGADVVYTEFVSSDALAYGAPSVIAKLNHRDEERPTVAQIFGKHPEAFAAAAKRVEQLGFDGLDINFGCPARKVVGSGSGVSLLRDPAYARTLVESALAATSLPVSIKIRASIRKERPSVAPHDETRVTAIDFLQALRGLPIAAVMVHGRTAEAGHDGEVDHALIKQVKEIFPGVVLANGGILAPQDAVTMLERTGADGVGIARGAWGYPTIFSDIRGALGGQRVALTADEAMVLHAELAVTTKGRRGILEFRKHLAKYISGFPGAALLRRRAVSIESIDDVRAVIENIPR